MAGVPAFEPGSATPITVGINTNRPPDPITVLPPRSRDRLEKLRLHVVDLHSLIPQFEDRLAAGRRKSDAAARLKHLTDHPQDSGFNLKPGDPRVIAAEEELEAATEAHRVIDKRYQQRSTAHQAQRRPLRH